MSFPEIKIFLKFYLIIMKNFYIHFPVFEMENWIKVFKKLLIILQD